MSSLNNSIGVNNDELFIQHACTLKHLYVIEKKTLKDVKEEMERTYGFPEMS